MNYFFEALRKYAQFTGRARRKEYWYFTLFSSIMSVILLLIGALINIPSLETIYSLGILIPSIAVGVRRMHDVNKSGWFILIPIYSLILNCTDGTSGPNEYGDDPKGRQGFGAADYEKPFEINS